METMQPTDREPLAGRSARANARGHVRPHEAREQQAAKDWVREHQDIAMIAAFALGVFMGVWMRS